MEACHQIITVRCALDLVGLGAPGKPIGTGVLSLSTVHTLLTPESHSWMSSECNLMEQYALERLVFI